VCSWETPKGNVVAAIAYPCGGDPRAKGLALIAPGTRLAPERWVGRVAPRPVVMLSARGDERIPRSSTDAPWAATGEPREQVWLSGRHVQGDRLELLRALVD